MLKLSGQKPIAAGGERLVFVHPQQKDWLVKVVNFYSSKSPVSYTHLTLPTIYSV